MKDGDIMECHQLYFLVIIFILGLHDLQDWADIEFGISEGVDFIAMSFVKDANAIKQLKSYLSNKSSK